MQTNPLEQLLEGFVILDDEIFDSYDEELMKISNGNGISFREGLQRKDVEQVIGSGKTFTMANIIDQRGVSEKLLFVNITRSTTLLTYCTILIDYLFCIIYCVIQ